MLWAKKRPPLENSKGKEEAFDTYFGKFMEPDDSLQDVSLLKPINVTYNHIK